MDEERRHNRRAGFTLIEIVVAMAIVGLGVVTLLEIFSLGLRLGARSTADTESMAYGRLVMDEVLARRDIDAGATQGTIQNRGRWQLRTQKIDEPQRTLSLDAPWELREVSLTMRLNDGLWERQIEIKTLRLVRKPDS